MGTENDTTKTNTQVDPNAGAAGDQNATPTLDEESIRQLVNKSVNSALTNHLKRLKIEDQVGSLVAKQFEAITRANGAAQAEAKHGEQTQAAPTGTQPKPDEKTPPSPEAEELRKKVAALEKQAKEAKAEKDKMRRRAEKNDARSQIRAAFEKSGVRPEMLDTLVDAVTAKGSAKRALKRNAETGEFEFRVTRARGKDEQAEEVAFTDLTAGVRDWLKTDDAKPFLPPPLKKAPPTPGPGMRPAGAGWQPGGGYPVAQGQQDPVSKTLEQLNANGVDLSVLYRDD